MKSRSGCEVHLTWPVPPSCIVSLQARGTAGLLIFLYRTIVPSGSGMRREGVGGTIVTALNEVPALTRDRCKSPKQFLCMGSIFLGGVQIAE
jgi:hypothetical protein